MSPATLKMQSCGTVCNEAFWPMVHKYIQLQPFVNAATEIGLLGIIVK